jgi:membrane-associated phospholipid phosphatase
VRPSLLASSDPLDNRHDFRVVNDWAKHTGWLHGSMEAVATYGVIAFAALLLAGWWLARRARDDTRMAAALWAPVAALVAVAVNQPIVGTVREARPFTAMPRVLLLVHHSADPGFPSDHATMAGAVAVGLWFVHRRLAALAAVAAVLLAFARVYVGVHYPGDVLAGLALGGVVAVVGAVVVVPWVARLVAWLRRTPLRPLLRA